MLKFQIEQVALHPRNPELAIQFLTDIGLGEWAKDHVKATGAVRGFNSKNEANLAFNYESFAGDKPLELEVLHYTDGPNWMAGAARVSHLGMHVTADELSEWRTFMANNQIKVAQEVNTYSHTNPVIAGKREYTYVIFDTYAILGVDLKFIVRREVPPVPQD